MQRSHQRRKPDPPRRVVHNPCRTDIDLSNATTPRSWPWTGRAALYIRRSQDPWYDVGSLWLYPRLTPFLIGLRLPLGGIRYSYSNCRLRLSREQWIGIRRNSLVSTVLCHIRWTRISGSCSTGASRCPHGLCYSRWQVEMFRRVSRSGFCSIIFLTTTLAPTFSPTLSRVLSSAINSIGPSENPSLIHTLFCIDSNIEYFSHR